MTARAGVLMWNIKIFGCRQVSCEQNKLVEESFSQLICTFPLHELFHLMCNLSSAKCIDWSFTWGVSHMDQCCIEVIPAATFYAANLF
jgi:hypothetical protein